MDANGKIINPSTVGYRYRNGNRYMGDSLKVPSTHKAPLRSRVAYYLGITDAKPVCRCLSHVPNGRFVTDHSEPTTTTATYHSS